MSLAEASQVLMRLPTGWSRPSLVAAASQLHCVVLLRTSWYPEILGPLEASARAYLKESGVPDEAVHTVDVPGALELPLAADMAFDGKLGRLARAAELVVALGCVLRGETPHFEYVCATTSQGLMQVQLRHHKALGFGLLTVDNQQQAMSRKDKGAEAAQAALHMHLLQLSPTGETA